MKFEPANKNELQMHGIPDRQANSAFTLTELLTVVAIIGVLAALLLSAISQVKSKALRVQCGHNLSQLGIALQQFVTDNHVYPLLVNPPPRVTYPEHNGSWYGALERGYISTAARSFSGGVLNKGVWHCPAARKPSTFTDKMGYGTYAYNSYGMSSMADTNSLGLGGHFVWSGSRWPAPPVAESEVVGPSAMMAIADDFRGGNGIIQDGHWLLGRTYGLTNYFGNSTQRSHSRHQGVANVMFCDGHLESPTLNSLFEATGDAVLARWNRDNLPHREKLAP